MLPTERRLCLVVPCYNEAARLDVTAFRTFLQDETHTRILFVDDGSTDDTANVLKRVCAGLESQAEILACQHNVGKAEAVRRGILYALHHMDPEFAGFWDADLATPLQAVFQLLDVLDRDPRKEMVFGARVKLLGRFVERNPARHYLGRVFATVVSNVLGLPIYDTQCGAKIFRVTPLMRQVFAEPFISKWVFDVEIIARFLRAYGRHVERMESSVYEYPLECWVDVAGSKVKPKDFFLAFWDLVRIRAKYLP